MLNYIVKWKDCIHLNSTMIRRVLSEPSVTGRAALLFRRWRWCWGIKTVEWLTFRELASCSRQRGSNISSVRGFCERLFDLAKRKWTQSAEGERKLEPKCKWWNYLVIEDWKREWLATFWRNSFETKISQQQVRRSRPRWFGCIKQIKNRNGDDWVAVVYPTVVNQIYLIARIFSTVLILSNRWNTSHLEVTSGNIEINLVPYVVENSQIHFRLELLALAKKNSKC